jgi:hypothetical protein
MLTRGYELGTILRKPINHEEEDWRGDALARAPRELRREYLERLCTGP